MSSASVSLQTGARTEWSWLRSGRWDLFFISFSVIMVAAPYAVYLLLLRLGGIVQPVADFLGTDAEGVSRNAVNYGVALLVGGPHMYVTLARTAMDPDFTARHRRFTLSALVIPVIVVALAFLNLTVLLTVFFFWASIHVLHQIIYVTELYNIRKKKEIPLLLRGADYAVILTALYPLAAWKIATGRFLIGPNNLGDMVGQVVPVGPWMVWLAGGAFAISLVAWVAKSVYEWRQGSLHGPKTLYIALTVTASFFVPALGNLDTAFQGMNVWHSFQYLALTWLLIHLSQQRGQLRHAPFVDRIARPGGSPRYYGFAMAMTVGTIVLAAAMFVGFRYGLKDPFDLAFDRAYYIAVLSFLWVHYYYDHFLFARPKALVGQRP